MSLSEQTLPTGTWQLDPVHSQVGFAVKHSGIATFRGHFSDVQASLVDGVLTGSAKVASVEVPVDQLKGHLLAPDFFDAEQYPEVTFTATSLTQDGENATVQGELTLKGVTKPLEATGTVSGPATYLDGSERIAIEISTVIDRNDFGVSWNADLPSGGKAVGDDVTITAGLQLVKPAA
jgi:polyisoprenoid-binding protein YceI